MSSRNGLFQQDEEGNTDDPIEIHNTADEEQCHQKSATHEAKSPVFDSHPKGTERSRAPMMRHELKWAAAVLKASVLKWRELVKARYDEHDPSK
jgi:hypothetical protein